MIEILAEHLARSDLWSQFATYDGWLRFMNGAFMWSCLCLCLIFGRSILEDVAAYPDWYDHDTTRHSIANFTVFLGGGIARSWSLVLLKLQDFGVDTKWYEEMLPVHLFGSLVFVIGAACLIRLWTRTRYGWIAATLTTVLAAFGAVVITP